MPLQPLPHPLQKPSLLILILLLHIKPHHPLYYGIPLITRWYLINISLQPGRLSLNMYRNLNHFVRLAPILELIVEFEKVDESAVIAYGIGVLE